MEPPLTPPHEGLVALDYAAVAAYLLFTFGIALWFARGQHSTSDYFLGGRRMPWFVVGLSILATLMSTQSYLGVPGEFVRNGVGFFFAYLAVPFSMAVVLFVWVPFFMRLRLTSAYEYLERRFNYPVRLTASVLFVLLRLGWMSMVVYVVAMVVDEMKGPDIAWLPGSDIYWWVLLVGVFAALYTALGGIQAMLWTDVLQFLLMLVGVLLTIGYAAYYTGAGPVGWWQTAAANTPSHTSPPIFSWDVTVRVTVVTVMLHNFFWTICTHGSDQVVLQRYFSTPSLAAARRTYLTHVTAEMTMLVLLALSGLALLALYLEHPSWLPAGQSAVARGDKLFPYFLAHQLPAGCAGLIMAGFVCDALQTLEAGVNSITAVVTTDFERLRPGGERRPGGLALARLLTVAIAALVTLNALWVTHYAQTQSQTILDLMPKTFNLFVGPLAALFFIGMFLPRCTARSALPAVFAGMAVSVTWSWWKAIFGTTYSPTVFLAIVVPCVFTFGCAAVLGLVVEGPMSAGGRAYNWWSVVRQPEVPQRGIGPNSSVCPSPIRLSRIGRRRSRREVPMPVTYTDRARQAGEHYAALQQATGQLESVLGPSFGSVKAEWDRVEDDKGRTSYALRLSDRTDEASARFAPDELQSSTQMLVRLHLLWGEILGARTDRKLQELQSAGSPEG